MNEAGKADCQPQPHIGLAGRGFRGYRPPFSGTISTVMPNDANQNDRCDVSPSPPEQPAAPPREVGGREGPEPTRFGDWELKGRCIDF